MKTTTGVLLVLVAVASAAFAQDKAVLAKQENGAFSARSLMVSGKVSSDGKTLLTDIDSEWNVSNAEALKGHEGRMVTVKCYVDTGKNQLQVLYVKPTKSEVHYDRR